MSPLCLIVTFSSRTVSCKPIFHSCLVSTPLVHHTTSQTHMPHTFEHAYRQPTLCNLTRTVRLKAPHSVHSLNQLLSLNANSRLHFLTLLCPLSLHTSTLQLRNTDPSTHVPLISHTFFSGNIRFNIMSPAPFTAPSTLYLSTKFLLASLECDFDGTCVPQPLQPSGSLASACDLVQLHLLFTSRLT
jgi:hypothetical protein